MEGDDKQVTPIVSTLIQNYKWLKANHLAHEDIVIDELANPELTANNKKFISFSSNNYLGLSTRKEVLHAAKRALLKYTGSTSESRKLGGNLKILEELEDELSKFKGKEDTIIFASGLLANIGTISAITDVNFYMKLFYNKPYQPEEVIIFGDQLNHRSIQMGIKLSKAKFIKYRHNDMEDLEKKLSEYKKQKLFIITDSIFSMDGDLANLDTIVSLAKEYKAALMIDDAHGTGVFGRNGRGVAEHFNVCEGIDFHMGTLSKALGGLGGFVSAKKELIDMLKINTSTYYFTSSLPADQAAGLIAAIKIVSSENNLRVKLWKNVHKVIKGLYEIGLDFPLRYSQIIPVMLYEEKLSYALERYLFNNGILCNAVTVPAVAPGKARLRISINATHTEKHIDTLLSVLHSAKRELKLPTLSRNHNDWNRFQQSAPEYIIDYIKM